MKSMKAQTDQQEKKKAFMPVNWQAWVEMYHIREQFADFRPRDEHAAEKIVAACVRPSTREYLARMEKYPTEAKKLLRVVRDVLAAERVVTDPPRPMICIEMITVQVLSFTVERVIERVSHPQTFVLWYDVAMGIMEVTGSLSFAMQPEQAAGQQMVKLTYTAQREYGTAAVPPHVQQISDARWQEEVTQAAHLFKQDPSGLTLIDAVVAELKAQAEGKPISERWRIEEHQIPTFVIAGAEQAQAIYKALYPLTEKL